MPTLHPSPQRLLSATFGVSPLSLLGFVGAVFRHLPLLMPSTTVVFSSRQWILGDSKVRVTVRGETAPSPAQLQPKASAPLLLGGSSLHWSQGQI